MGLFDNIRETWRFICEEWEDDPATVVAVVCIVIVLCALAVCLIFALRWMVVVAAILLSAFHDL